MSEPGWRCESCRAATTDTPEAVAGLWLCAVCAHRAELEAASEGASLTYGPVPFLKKVYTEERVEEAFSRRSSRNALGVFEERVAAMKAKGREPVAALIDSRGFDEMISALGSRAMVPTDWKPGSGVMMLGGVEVMKEPMMPFGSLRLFDAIDWGALSRGEICGENRQLPLTLERYREVCAWVRAIVAVLAPHAAVLFDLRHGPGEESILCAVTLQGETAETLLTRCHNDEGRKFWRDELRERLDDLARRLMLVAK